MIELVQCESKARICWIPFVAALLMSLVVTATSCSRQPGDAPEVEPTLDSAGSLNESATTMNGLDGEGSAILAYPNAMVAGKPTRVVVEFRVGPSGLPIGGGVSLGLHHAAYWSNIQGTKPENPGYVAAMGPQADSIVVAYHAGRPASSFVNPSQGNDGDRLYYKSIVATVVNRPLIAGERILFTLGANDHLIEAPRSTDPDNEFRISTDVNGDGAFLGIDHSPVNRIVPGNATHLAANIPAQIKVGMPFDVFIRAEDEFYNLASDANGTLRITGEDGTILAEHVPLTHGIGKARVLVAATGPHRLRLSNRSGSLAGRSNPARAYAELPALKLYWGDVHGHTGVSDGLGADANEFFKFGRDIAALDVIALTDHGHFDWMANIEAVQEFYAPGEYVTILAQEAGANVDHMNLYFRRDNAAHISHWQNEIAAFYRHIHEQYNSGAVPEAITGPHHFSYDRGDDRYPFGVWDSRSARFVEVYSSHGTSEFPGNDRPLPGAYAGASKYMQHGLSQGLRFGVIGSSDNHDSKPGRSIWGNYPGGLAGFWAEQLTRESIWDAMWNYRVYATSLDRIYLEFRVNGRIMGSDFSAAAPVILDAYIIGKTDALQLAVIRDNLEIHRVGTDSGLIELTLEDSPGKGEHFYYLRVAQSNGERAWSTPIWVNIE